MIFLIPYSQLTVPEHQALLDIRNEPEIVCYTQSKSIISLDDHLLWVQSLNKQYTSSYWAIVHNHQILGGIHTHFQSNNALWGVFFHAKTSPHITSAVSFSFLDTLFFEKNVSFVQGLVHPKNIQAIKFNQRLGFECIDQKDGFMTMNLKKASWEQKRISSLLAPIKKFSQHITFQEKL